MTRTVLYAVLLVFGVLGAAGLILSRSAERTQHGAGVEPASGPGTAAPPAAFARRETRPTLDPASFDGKARLAYQVAREIPDVLDQVRCYCACDVQYGHVSLLSCYTDGHAAT